MAEIGLVASVIAVIQIAAAVTTQAYNYGLKFKHAKEDLNGINSEITNVRRVLEKLELVAEQAEQSGKPLATWPALLVLKAEDGPLAKCNQALLDLRSELTPASGLRDKLTQRVKWAWRKDKVEKSLQTIVNQKIAFLEMLSVDQMSQMLKTGLAINEKLVEDKKIKKREMIKWLSPTDPGTTQQAARKKHEAKTGEWFTKSYPYQAWLTQPNSLLWLHGIPGSGKTVLCSEIIENTSKYCRSRKGYRIAYFYFSFRDIAQQKASNLPRSILAQLLQQMEMIPETLEIFFDKTQYGQPPEGKVVELIQTLITDLPLFVIIDALDECPNTGEERAELCNILKDMHSWGIDGLHILVTSRMEADLSDALLPIVTQEPIGIQGSVVETDIRMFVRSYLQNDKKLSKWSPVLQAEIEHTLVKKANGMFRWVVCQFQSLSKCLCPSDIRTALSSLPRTLDETYERILVNIPIEYRLKAITALRWIVHSGQAYVDAIADVIIINPEADPPFNVNNRLPDPFWISEILPGLITFNSRLLGSGNTRHVIEIAHFSVVEYLESARILDGPALMFHLDKEQANISILQECLQLLKSSVHPTNQSLMVNDGGDYFFSPFTVLVDYARTYCKEHIELLSSVAATNKKLLNGLGLEMFDIPETLRRGHDEKLYPLSAVVKMQSRQ